MACPRFVSTARLFVQLTARRSPSAPAASSILDLLLPATPVRRFVTTGSGSSPAPSTHDVSSATASASASITPRSRRLRPHQSHHSNGVARPVGTASPRASSARAAFSTSPSRRATTTIFNPQKDEDGNDMALEITPRAAHRLSQIMEKDSNPHLALRIQVESGGCHGFQYIMRLVTLPPSLPSAAGSTPEASTETSGGDSSSSTEPTIGEDDTIFAYSGSEPAVSESMADGGLSAPKIILDSPSLELLKGSKLDFTMELIGSQFKIVDNPLATSSCGCGTSFDIKI